MFQRISVPPNSDLHLRPPYITAALRADKDCETKLDILPVGAASVGGLVGRVEQVYTDRPSDTHFVAIKEDDYARLSELSGIDVGDLSHLHVLFRDFFIALPTLLNKGVSSFFKLLSPRVLIGIAKATPSQTDRLTALDVFWGVIDDFAPQEDWTVPETAKAVGEVLSAAADVIRGYLADDNSLSVTYENMRDVALVCSVATRTAALWKGELLFPVALWLAAVKSKYNYLSAGARHDEVLGYLWIDLIRRVS